MCDTLELFIATRRLRSSDNYVLNVPRYNLKSYGGRVFSVAAPKFKFRTYLFNIVNRSYY